ncbi:MAG: AAA family ATPase [Flavitalea sp.]
MEDQLFETSQRLKELQEQVVKLRTAIGKVIVGQDQMIELLLAAILADGHVLIEGVPGVAKTLTAKLMSKAIDVSFSRIQFTPDLMPGDVIGTTIYNNKENTFEFKPGPVFSNIILIDEINRAPAKTQAALFEVMEERQVTVDGTTFILEAPFLVMATQNPIEQEGTYQLPEAQLDRFLFKINVGYPTREEEVQILLQHHNSRLQEMIEQVGAVISRSDLELLRTSVREVRVENKLLEFIAEIVSNTRNHKSIFLGASPRASVGILQASKAIAAMHGREFVTPEDVIFVSPSVLRHRIILTPDKEMEGTGTDDVISQLIGQIEIPR